MERIINLNTHLHREEYFDNDLHQRCVDSLEQSFHENHSSMRDTLILGARTPDMARSSEAVFLWDAASSGHSDAEALQKEAIFRSADRPRAVRTRGAVCTQSRAAPLASQKQGRGASDNEVLQDEGHKEKGLCRVQDGGSEEGATKRGTSTSCDLPRHCSKHGPAL